MYLQIDDLQLKKNKIYLSILMLISNLKTNYKYLFKKFY